MLHDTDACVARTRRAEKDAHDPEVMYQNGDQTIESGPSTGNEENDVAIIHDAHSGHHTGLARRTDARHTWSGTSIDNNITYIVNSINELQPDRGIKESVHRVSSVSFLGLSGGLREIVIHYRRASPRSFQPRPVRRDFH